MLVLPLLYYDHGQQIAGLFSVSPRVFLLILLVLMVLIESLRLQTGLVFFGQRKHEARRISSFGWGMLGIALVLFLAPGPAFGIPIIWSLALGDPFLGEARRWLPLWLAEVMGLLVVVLIWWFCAYWLGISMWWGVCLAPITVAVEWLNLKWVDDNVLMLLVPLAVVLIVGGALH